MKKKDKRINLRISEDTYIAIRNLAKETKKDFSNAVRDIVEDQLMLRRASSLEALIDQMATIAPDFKQYQTSFNDIKARMTEALQESGKIMDLVNDMKKGEGFYFKNIYETLKIQQTQFAELIAVLSANPQEDPPPKLTDSPSEKPSKSAAELYLENIGSLKSQVYDPQNH